MKYIINYTNQLGGSKLTALIVKCNSDINASHIKIKSYLIFGPGIFTKIYNDLVKSRHIGKYIVSGFNTSLLDFDGNFILATRLNHYQSKVDAQIY